MVTNTSHSTPPTANQASRYPAKSQDMIEKCSHFDNTVIPPLPMHTLRAHLTFALTHPNKKTVNTILHTSGSLTQALQAALNVQLQATVHNNTERRALRPLPALWQQRLHARHSGLWQVRTTTLSAHCPKANLTGSNNKIRQFRALEAMHKTGPFIFAQTLIPSKRLIYYGTDLLNCDDQPIGNLIFAKRQAPKRQWLFIGKVGLHKFSASVRQRLQQETQALVTPGAPLETARRKTTEIAPKSLWLRQSLLLTHPKPIIITEIILPGLIHSLRERDKVLHLTPSHTV